MLFDLRALALFLGVAFLAVGLGVVIGVTRVGDAVDQGEAAVLRRLEADFDHLREELHSARLRAEQGEELVAGLTSLAVAGRLQGQAVRLVALSADERTRAEAEDAAAVLRRAGSAAVDVVVPDGDRWGPATPRDAAAGFALEVASRPVGEGEDRPAGRAPTCVVLVRAGGDRLRRESLASLVEALRAAGVRVVAFEPVEVEAASRAEWRRLRVTSVVGLGGPAGHAALVWSVAGSEGQFGPGAGADALLPPPSGP